VEFRLLGPLEVSARGESVAITGKRRRTLLIRLLLSPNRPVPDDRLAFDLWIGSPPAGARSTLASHISLLRRAIGSDRLLHRAGGYEVIVHPGELDVEIFESELDAAQAHVRSGEPGLAVQHFEAGLALWREGVPVEIEGAEWAQGEIARLDELRLAAAESCLICQLALGRAQDVVAPAELAVRSHPLRERGWAILMTALYRSGRQAEALRAFQRLRSYLAENVGVEPSPELADLEEAVVLQRAELPSLGQPGEAAPGHRAGPDRLDVSTVLAVKLSSSESPSRSDQALILADVLAAHGGRQLRVESGCSLIQFANPTAALEAGVSLQRLYQGRYGQGAATGVAIEPSGHDAAALARRARPGDILLTDQVRTLFDTGSLHGFAGLSTDSTGPFGHPTALRLQYDLSGVQRAGDRHLVPLAGALTESSPPFVGRHSARAELDRLFDRAGNGERQVAVVSGEPGIGKSSLVASLARRVHASGTTVLYGRCLEVASHPYQPFCEALGHLVEHADPEELARHVERFGGELSRLVPELMHRVATAPPPTTSDADTERFLAFRAAIGLVETTCARRPVLLILEDLHWADASTLALLQHLSSGLVQSALLIVGTFRSSELGPDHPLVPVLAALWRERAVSRLDLDGLTVAEVVELCRTMTGESDDDSVQKFATGLRRETGGNAFFLCELLRNMSEEEVLQVHRETVTATGNSLHPALPPSLQEVVTHRIRRLGARAERMLALAAVIGESFTTDVLASIADVEAELVEDVLEEARRAAILFHGEGKNEFTFAHALIRRVLYESTRPARRRELHARVATALERVDASSSLLAYHYLAADMDDLAVVHVERAGRAALGSMAPVEAAQWFAEAEVLLERIRPDEDRRRCDAAIQRGIALKLAGDPTFREVLLGAGEMAKVVGDARRMAFAALANTRGYYSAAGVRDQDRLDALSDALSLLGGSDPALRARLLATVSSESLFGMPLSKRRALARDAKRAASEVDDARTQLDVINLVAETQRFPTELSERLRDTAVALELAEQIGDPAARFWAIGHRMRSLVEAGQIDTAELLFERMSEVSEQLGQPVMRWMTVFTSAQWALLKGQTAAGEQLAEEALQLGTDIGQPDAFNYYATQISHARWQQGRLVEILDLIEQGMVENPGIPAYRGALARAYCQAGRLADAQALVTSAARDRFTILPEDLLWTYGMVTFAEAAIELRDVEASAILYELLAPFEDQVSYLGTTCEGPIAHSLGGLAVVLGNLRAASGHLEVATDFATRARSPFFACRSRLESGRCLALGGDPSAAMESLQECASVAEEAGFSGERQRAIDALAALDSLPANGADVQALTHRRWSSTAGNTSRAAAAPSKTS
jgi:DNA-binding SARP family transcriptional activator/tetratricopeptide (TPR) repeat protein